MIKQIREDTGEVYWEMWDDDGRIATIRKVDRIYVGEFEHYNLKHRTKKNVINHIKLILKPFRFNFFTKRISYYHH